ncbi:MAG: hypothetical protein GY867_05000, partial [bacterium]|nr:hypothetical protein [bacterium]
RIDLGQILGALEIRAEAWETTAAYARGEEIDPGVIVEEHSSAREAETIASDYRRIIDEIERQTT